MVTNYVKNGSGKTIKDVKTMKATGDADIFLYPLKDLKDERLKAEGNIITIIKYADDDVLMANTKKIL